MRSALRAMALVCLVSSAVVSAQDAPLKGKFRVCSDPQNMPFSNDRLDGFENRIAALIAKAVSYTHLTLPTILRV